MKTKIYLRIAKNKKSGIAVSATTRPSHEPLHAQTYGKAAFPTVAFAVEFDIPDELFKQAEEVVAKINLRKKNGVVCGKISAPAASERETENT